MCISAGVSFVMGTVLLSGGMAASYKATHTDRRYLALGIFPVLIGIQQIGEGFVWLASDTGHEALIRTAALFYLFFTWIIWPFWVPYMTAQLEPDRMKKRFFQGMAVAGLALGAALYLPNFWMPDWLSVSTIHHSIVYECTFLMHSFLPISIPYMAYLALIGLPPLLSSHRSLQFFGMALISFVFVTYYLFAYAHVSVLCFFAALMITHILYIILADKCRTADTYRFAV